MLRRLTMRIEVTMQPDLEQPERIVWTPWIPLLEAVAGHDVPAGPGLYRIRRKAMESLDYIGHTGGGQMGLRNRMAMLGSVYGAHMPYQDPYPAGPGLWALHHKFGSPFEVSFAQIVGGTRWRKGLEAVAIAEYRARFRCSPTANFGRMPEGYRMSSTNNSRTVPTGVRFHGGPVAGRSDASHMAGVPPAGPLSGPTDRRDWCGHAWSVWTKADDVPANIGVGLYRIRGQSGNLIYVGEGAVSSRIHEHLLKIQLQDYVQGRIFADNTPLWASWVVHPWLMHQRRELETDMIAAVVLTQGKPPEAQFLG